MMSDGVSHSEDHKVDFMPEKGIIDNSIEEEEVIAPAKQIYQKMYNSMQQQQPSFDE
jgi:hypothetical protein